MEIYYYTYIWSLSTNSSVIRIKQDVFKRYWLENIFINAISYFIHVNYELQLNRFINHVLDSSWIVFRNSSS